MSVPRDKTSASKLLAVINKSTRHGRYKVSPKEARTYEGIVFDSKWESETYKLLTTLLPSNVTVHRQVDFLLQEKFKGPDGKAVREIRYSADFVITRDKELKENSIPSDAIVIDSKGHLTDIFKIKNKLFMYRYRALIHQVKSAKDVAAVVDLYKAQ